jgi:hypothetical protein
MISHHVALTSTLAVYELFVPNRPPLEDRVLEAMAPEVRQEYLNSRARLTEPGAFAISPELFRKAEEFSTPSSRPAACWRRVLTRRGTAGRCPDSGTSGTSNC